MAGGDPQLAREDSDEGLIGFCDIPSLVAWGIEAASLDWPVWQVMMEAASTSAIPKLVIWNSWRSEVKVFQQAGFDGYLKEFTIQAGKAGEVGWSSIVLETEAREA